MDLDADPNTDPDADPDPAIFIIDLQDANKKLIKQKKFSAYYYMEEHLHYFSKSKNSRNQGFSCFFCLFGSGFATLVCGIVKVQWLVSFLIQEESGITVVEIKESSLPGTVFFMKNECQEKFFFWLTRHFIVPLCTSTILNEAIADKFFCHT